MKNYAAIILPICVITYFILVFVVHSLLVAKRIGKSPFVFPKDDSAYALIGYYFKIYLIALFLYSITYGYLSDTVLGTAIIPVPHHLNLVMGGALIVFSLIWTLIAQRDMRNSWRIGIDTEKQTELITTGLFSISRNPTFLGMLLNLLGIFILTPNAIMLGFLITGFLLIQIQIRLEEAFLSQAHGMNYSAYKSKIRRLI